MGSSYTLQELATRLKATLVGNPAHVITGVAGLETASAEEASFLANLRYTRQMLESKAGVVVVSAQIELPLNRNFLVVNDPSSAFQVLIELFKPPSASHSGFTGIHSTAVIHESAVVDPTASIGPYVVIDAGVSVGANSVISAHCSLGPNVKIGTDCLLYPHVVIREDCVLGNRVIIQPGAVIGSCGFGYTQDKLGKHKKLHQVGNVVIEDDVEIGANTTIDRARFQSTRIGEGTKIDNQVQIAHGVEIGKYNLLIAQVGIAGSSTTGNYVILAGQVAVNGHIEIGDYVKVAACSGVSKSILKPGEYAGVPVMPLGEHNRNSVRLRNIEKLIDEHKLLQEKVEELIKKESSF